MVTEQKDDRYMGNIIERELMLDARAENYQKVKDFVRESLADILCEDTVIMQTCMAAEEIFTNIAYYAYDDGEEGTAVIRLKADPESKMIELVFIDSGQKYDPLVNEDPDITLNARKRRIGGLGIFITKQVMDEISHEYKDGKNVLTMKKALA